MKREGKHRSKEKSGGHNPALALLTKKPIPKRVALPPPPPPKVSSAEEEEFADLLPNPLTVPLDDLRRGAVVDNVEETEQSRRFLGLLIAAYRSAQDAALATAQLELQVVADNVSPEGESPDEFDADKFLNVQRKLLELRVLKDFGEAFGLGTYLDRIMATRIEALFGSHPVSVTAGPDGQTSFYGSDEAYLRYRTKAALKQGQ